MMRTSWGKRRQPSNTAPGTFTRYRLAGLNVLSSGICQVKDEASSAADPASGVTRAASSIQVLRFMVVFLFRRGLGGGQARCDALVGEREHEQDDADTHERGDPHQVVELR